MARFRALLAVLMLGTILMVPATASAAPPTSTTTVPVVSTVPGVSSFSGNLDLTRFTVQNGALVAIGTLTGTVTNLVTGATQTISRVVTFPVSVTGTCDILHLDLGPLDLTVLGLHIHLNEVVLDITAQQGGGLLGNLLCAVANLLNGGGPLGQIAALLNQILAILG